MEPGNSEVDPKVGGPVLTVSTGGDLHPEGTLETFMVLSGSIPGPWLRCARTQNDVQDFGIPLVKPLQRVSVDPKCIEFVSVLQGQNARDLFVNILKRFDVI